jgi:tetraacyldisaccharide 4'-kinase
LLNTLYSQLARARRRYYQRRPHLRRRLTAPVISVGNLTVGGSGKTPLAAEIARMLVAMNERPSILSRGYARKIASEGVVIVSDGSSVLADEAHAGDEPLMLARTVPGAAVLVASSRYFAGRIAEQTLGCTVHVLDDGFQHFDLMRDVDLLVAPDTFDDVRTLPFGRFREPLDAAQAADALLVEAPQERRAEALRHRSVAAGAVAGAVAQDFSPAIAARLNVPVAFEFSRRIGGPPADRPAYAFAGIARPWRFYEDLERAGWRLTGRRSFGDHHHYSNREIDELVRAAGDSGAQVVLTTEKDMVRVESAGTTTAATPIVAIPLELTISPSLQPWLADRLRAARARVRRA